MNSGTCFYSIQGSCVSSCRYWENGNYQSCKTCHGYVTCSNQIYYTRTCPAANLVWDDYAKQCLSTSRTCPLLQTTTKTNSNFIFLIHVSKLPLLKKNWKFIFSLCNISIIITGIDNGTSAFHCSH